MQEVRSMEISGNDNFHRIARKFGWKGDGTKENPYVISGIEMHLNDEQVCETTSKLSRFWESTFPLIFIRNTDVYCVIEGCRLCIPFCPDRTLTSIYVVGIELMNAKNVVVRNNTISGYFDYGIYSSDCDNIHIIDNIIYGTRLSGIFISGLHDSIIAYNKITFNDNGAHDNGIEIKNSSSKDSKRNFILYNIILRFPRGIYIIKSKENYILYNVTINEKINILLSQMTQNNVFCGNLLYAEPYSDNIIYIIDDIHEHNIFYDNYIITHGIKMKSKCIIKNYNLNIRLENILIHNIFPKTDLGIGIHTSMIKRMNAYYSMTD